MESITLTYHKKKITIPAQRCSFFGKFWGLMFSRKSSAPLLLFDFRRSVAMGIHSYFVFYDFLAIWIDEKNTVVQVDRVKPWTSYLKPRKRYHMLIEIPMHKRYKKYVDFFMKC